MGGDYWQTHRSVWEPEDLEALGFKVEVWEDFHREDDAEHGVHFVHVMWAKRIL